MAAPDINEIKKLRELTGVGITDAKKALIETGGDFDKALSAMRKKGLTKAEKSQQREARVGVVGSYVHDNRIGALVEVNCETDFVARNEIFTNLVKDLCLQVVASAPEYVSMDQIPESAKKAMEKEFTAKVKAEGKPAKIIPGIVEGMLKKHFAEKCLLDQPFVRNLDVAVGDYIKENIAKLGENIVVRRFLRMALGEV